MHAPTFKRRFSLKLKRTKSSPPPPPTEAAITLPALLPRSTSSPEPSATTSRPRSAPTPRAAPPSAGMMSMMEEAFSDDSNTVALAGPRHKGEVILPCTIM